MYTTPHVRVGNIGWLHMKVNTKIRQVFNKYLKININLSMHPPNMTFFC